MVVSLKGDKDFENLLSVKDKALRINLNENIYGSFSEIGAGQEVARHFFRAGGASGTIDFAKKFKGHGWMGIRFQTNSNEEYSEIQMHVRFHLIDAKAQQEALGIMGVNLIYGAYYKHNKPRSLIKYLYDHIDSQAIEIDTINFSGPLFRGVDNRLMSLILVKNGMTQAVMFGPDGNNILPAAVLYKKNILAIRGSFRPLTKVNEDMYQKSFKMISNDKDFDVKNTLSIFEITLSNLSLIHI